jgi:hypothetical protein
MGNVVGSLLGTNRLTNKADELQGVARDYAEKSYFRPYTVTTGFGQTSYTPEGGYISQLSQPYQNILGTSLAGAGSLFQQAAEFDPTQRSRDIFREQASLLQPEFQRQATQLQSSLFGSGRLGLRLAGEGVGAGSAAGFIQPDAFGLGSAQQQTLAQLASQSRGQALGEQAQLQQLASGLLGAGMGISDLERQLISQGVDAETARAGAAYAAGQTGTSYFTPMMSAYQQKAKAQTDLFGGILGGIGKKYGFG